MAEGDDTNENVRRGGIAVTAFALGALAAGHGNNPPRPALDTEPQAKVVSVEKAPASPPPKLAGMPAMREVAPPPRAVDEVARAAALAPRPRHDRDGLRAFDDIQAMGTPLPYNDAIVKGLNEEEQGNYHAALSGAKILGAGYTIVLPDNIHALLGQEHRSPDGCKTKISNAQALAKAAGLDTLSELIQNEVEQSTHRAGRLTATQIKEFGFITDFGNPPLYNFRIINNRTKGEGRMHVDCTNFRDVGVALESLPEMEQSIRIMSASQYAAQERTTGASR